MIVKSRKILSLVIAVIMLVMTLAACATPSGSADTSAAGNGTNVAEDTTVPETGYKYEKPTADYTGRDLRIVTSDTWYSIINYMDADKITGDRVSDAVYTRNRKVESEYGITIKQTKFGIHDIVGKIEALCATGDDLYDAVYEKGESISQLLVKGYIMNLADIDSVRLGEYYWNGTVLDAARIGSGKSVFFAASDANVMTMEMSYVMYFNKDMCTKLGLDFPYELVSGGKWTVDKLNEYITAGKNLNGDAAYAYKTDGTCVYGMSSFGPVADALLAGCNASYCHKNSDGTVIYSAPSDDRYIAIADKIRTLFADEGNFLYANNTATGQHYVNLFRNERSFFIGGELKSAVGELGNMTAKFGVVPFPKYNEEQTKYYSNIQPQCMFLTIPSTVGDAEFAGAMMDVLAYESGDLQNEYFDYSVTYKGMKDVESVGMLDFIKNGQTIDYSMLYGWTTALNGQVRSIIIDNKTTLSSILGAYVNAIDKSIRTTLDTVN